MIETADVVRHKVPAGMLARLAMIAVGGALTVIGVQQALAFPYPIDLHNGLMFVTVASCLVFGVGFIHLALFAPERHWTIGRGVVEIDSDNPFRHWRQQFGRHEVEGLSVRKDDSGDGPTTWVVVLNTHAGKRFESTHMKSEEAADKLMRRMQNAFYG
jgi:hypothetical protein